MGEPRADLDEFFLVALPGLEDLVAAEVADWFSGLEVNVAHGGVTVYGPRPLALPLNQYLRTPTRVLLRVKEFRCRDFPRLYQTVRELNWKAYLNPECELEVEAASRLSRLKIKKRIEETVLEGFTAYQKQVGVKPKKGKRAKLYVRLHTDQCTLSLDTSGERLHKRGEKALIGEAPLRETIAAALIQWMGRESGVLQGVELMDPMMGTGTFLIEAARRDEFVTAREFSASQIAGVATESATKINPPSRPEIVKLVGYESDKKTFSAAQANLAGVIGAKKIAVALQNSDFFSAPALEKGSAPRWVIANPPYGERLKIKTPLKEYYESLFAAAERVAAPDRAVFILPAKVVKGKFNLPLGWKVKAKRSFSNGGIPVVAFLFARI